VGGEDCAEGFGFLGKEGVALKRRVNVLKFAENGATRICLCSYATALETEIKNQYNVVHKRAVQLETHQKLDFSNLNNVFHHRAGHITEPATFPWHD
jgi:hypothetical protein